MPQALLFENFIVSSDSRNENFPGVMGCRGSIAAVLGTITFSKTIHTFLWFHDVPFNAKFIFVHAHKRITCTIQRRSGLMEKAIYSSEERYTGV